MLEVEGGTRRKELTDFAVEARKAEDVGSAALGAGVESAVLADTVAGGHVGGHSEDAGDEGSNDDELHLGGFGVSWREGEIKD